MSGIGEFELHEQIGKGRFGVVYRATIKSTGEVVACKQYHIENFDDPIIEDLNREIDFLTYLNHDNIVKFKGYDSYIC